MDVIAWARRAPSWLADMALVVAVGVPTMMDAWWNESGTTRADALTYTAAAASVLILLGRRRAPLGVTLASGLALSGLYLRGHHGELLNLPVMVALYTVAVQGDRRRTAVVAAVAAAWSGLLGFTSDDPLGARGGSPVLEMVWPLIPLVLGEAVRARRELAAHAAVEQQREAARRVDAERTRMARELHDVLAHTLAAVNVQTAAAAAAFDTHPDIAHQSLTQARASIKAALTELRATLNLLRDGQDDTAPAPGLARLDDLVANARAAGIDVTTHIEEPTELPAGVSLAAYRIIQEAVTNTIRHSNARHLAISVSASHGTLRVEIADDGNLAPAIPPSGQPAGFGLLGMNERVNAVGGHLTHGHNAGGGYQVTATLPTNSQDTS